MGLVPGLVGCQACLVHRLQAAGGESWVLAELAARFLGSWVWCGPTDEDARSQRSWVEGWETCHISFILNLDPSVGDNTYYTTLEVEELESQGQ